MSTEQVQAANDSAIEWKTFSSKNGTSFQVGSKKTEGGTFDFLVDWTLGDSTWITTSKEIATVAGISRYRLYSTSIGKCRFDFTTTVTQAYIFTIASGEIFEINVFVKGDHSLQYNSSDPTITRVQSNF